jgi:hypothetical protein
MQEGKLKFIQHSIFDAKIYNPIVNKGEKGVGYDKIPGGGSKITHEKGLHEMCCSQLNKG